MSSDLLDDRKRMQQRLNALLPRHARTTRPTDSKKSWKNFLLRRISPVIAGKIRRNRKIHRGNPERPWLRGTTTVETRLSRSKPDRGLVRTKAELVNQDGAVPTTLVAVNFIARCPFDA
ncbi:MAG: hypothetical protein ACRDOI_09310 [Trebonia sp.]